MTRGEWVGFGESLGELERELGEEALVGLEVDLGGPRPELIGDINALGGSCDCCGGMWTKVIRYRRVVERPTETEERR